MRSEKTLEFVQFLSIAAVAAILGVSRPTVYKIVRRGEIPAIRVGDIVRIPETGLEGYLRSQGLDLETIYRGTGLPATARPSPAAPTRTDRRKPADAGAV